MQKLSEDVVSWNSQSVEGPFVNSNTATSFGLPTLDWKVLTELGNKQPALREQVFNETLKRRQKLNFKASVVAGSNGKTTVKELLKCILAETGRTSFASLENHNTKLAIATQILQMSSETDLAVFEVGARKQNDFQIPLNLIQPEVALLLNIGSSHVGEFGSYENLLATKLSILDGETLKTVALNGDDERILSYAKNRDVQKITFGYGHLNDIVVLGDIENTVELSVYKKHVKIRMQAPFVKRDFNVAAALATALAMDIPLETIVTALEKFKGVARRFTSLKVGETLIIDDAFNASPESVEAGLESFSKIATNQKVLLVLGSMLELGQHSRQLHQKIGRVISGFFEQQILNKNLSLVLVGEESFPIANNVGLTAENLFCYESVEHYQAHFKNQIPLFDLVYLKASKSINLQKLISSDAGLDPRVRS